MESQLESQSKQELLNEQSTIVHDDNNVQFGDSNSSGQSEENKEEDLSKYTLVDGDNLDEDEPIKGQEYALFSFMSPEGIMNCNVRAIKFRGAFSSLEKAQAKADELGKRDKYFKIFIGDSGKWLDFDPPISKVEKEVTSNKEHQRILDAQSQRMKKINELAGKHKEIIDKKENGKQERIVETQKAGAASDAVYRQQAKKEKKVEGDPPKVPAVNARAKALNNIKDRMRKKVAETQNQKKLEQLTKEENSNKTVPIDKKVEIVNKVSNELENKKAQLATATENIERIKKLMENGKNAKNVKK